MKAFGAKREEPELGGSGKSLSLSLLKQLARLVLRRYLIGAVNDERVDNYALGLLQLKSKLLFLVRQTSSERRMARSPQVSPYLVKRQVGVKSLKEVKVGGAVGHSAAVHTLPMRVGTIAFLPGACTIGEVYYASDAAVGSNIHQCSATNTWTAPSFGNQLPLTLNAPNNRAQRRGPHERHRGEHDRVVLGQHVFVRRLRFGHGGWKVLTCTPESSKCASRRRRSQNAGKASARHVVTIVRRAWTDRFDSVPARVIMMLCD